MCYKLGDIVYLGNDRNIRFVVTRIWPLMNHEDEYDGESVTGEQFTNVRESELTLAKNQTIDAPSDAYERAMRGI